MGASVHIKNDFGLYPIHLAASRGNKELCRILLSYKEVVIDATDQGLVCIQSLKDAFETFITFSLGIETFFKHP